MIRKTLRLAGFLPCYITCVVSRGAGDPHDTVARDDTYYTKTLASCAAAFDTVRMKVRGRPS